MSSAMSSGGHVFKIERVDQKRLSSALRVVHFADRRRLRASTRGIVEKNRIVNAAGQRAHGLRRALGVAGKEQFDGEYPHDFEREAHGLFGRVPPGAPLKSPGFAADPDDRGRNPALQRGRHRAVLQLGSSPQGVRVPSGKTMRDAPVRSSSIERSTSA